MKLFLELKDISGLSRDEIDAVAENAAASGYEGLVLPRTDDWDSIRAFCHSANRHSVKLWLRDDFSSPSGDFGGEITSVPSLAPKKLSLSKGDGGSAVWNENGLTVFSVPGGGLWGGDPFSDEAAEAFLECSYTDLRRELKRFLGYELTGIVTSVGRSELPWSEKLTEYILNKNGGTAATLYKKLFASNDIGARKSYNLMAGELFTDTTLRPLGQFCQIMKLELIADGDIPAPEADAWADFSPAFADLTGLTFAGRQRKLLELAASGTDRAAVSLEPAPTPVEALWCGRAERLGEMLPEPKPTDGDIPHGLKAVRSGDCTLVYNPTEDGIAGELDLEALGAGYVADLDGGLYLPLSSKLSFTLASGGCFALISGADREAGALPPYFNCGAVFCETETECEIVPELSGRDENRLPLDLKDGRCEFEVKYAYGDAGIKIEAEDAGFIRLNGHELKGSGIGDPFGPTVIGKDVLQMGRNVLETDGSDPELRGDFYTDGDALIPPAKPVPGNVRTHGLARYDGPLCYRAALPEACGGKHLLLAGSFSYALVKIGRRSQPLLQPPFMIPLFRSEAGRTAEIIIFPANDRKDISFGLNTANIVNVKF